MRVPLSWLRDYVALPEDVSGADLAARLIRAGLEVERVDVLGADVTGVVVGEVLAFDDEPQKNGKTDPLVPGRRRCGEEPRGIVCGAANFAVGDRVPSRCRERCCPGRSRSPPARPTATSPTA